MLKRFVFLFVLLVLVNILVYFGLPYLKQVKENPPKVNIVEKKVPPPEGRLVSVNITIESICQNMISGSIYDKCKEEGCDLTCQNQGCDFFGLLYYSSEYRGGCICNCIEQNKIKKALNPG